MVFEETRKAIRETLKKREIRIQELRLREQADALEEASSNALRAAEMANSIREFETAEELLDDSARLSAEAGEVRMQITQLRGER